MHHRLRPWLEAMEDRTLLSAFLVTNTGDRGPGSLRQAILSANASLEPDAVIAFEIPGDGVRTIAPTSALPPITGSVLLDGFSQPGYSGTPLIEINGQGAHAVGGLTIAGSGSTIRGLAIDGYTSGAAILIQGAGAAGNTVYGNQLGLNDANPRALANRYGVVILDGAHDNVIGGSGAGSDPAGAANQIRGNLAGGVLLGGASVDDGQGFNGRSGELTTNGSAAIQGSLLQLTYGSASQRASAFTSLPVDVTRFHSRFTFRLDNPSNGGFTFTIQGEGPNALGTNLGYSGIGKIATVTFLTNYYDWSNSTGLFLSGLGSGFGSISLDGTGIDLRPGGVYETDLSYDGSALLVAITDTATGSSFTFIDSVDIPGAVGGPTAYVGFTASAFSSSPPGPSTPAQAILDWTYTATAGAAGNRVANNVIVGNGGPGVAVMDDRSTGNAILANAIYGNSGPAIDLGNDGPTANAGARTPRPGPNNLPNAPVLGTTADGRLMGWLEARQPVTVYHLEFFAGAGNAADGSGEAQVYLGSLEVVTDAQGQVGFDVPFTPPADRPFVTATATDPQGNTSEVSSLRTGRILAPNLGYRLSPGQPLVLANAGLALQDPDAGPLDPTWSLTLSVPAGRLTMSPVPGLAVAGNGTGTLQLQGKIAPSNEALGSLTFTPPPGFHGQTALSVAGESAGARPLQVQLDVTDGIFLVTTIADGGPGSLRQAILDSNHAGGGPNTIAFALPGAGVRTIVLASPLPRATTPTRIDGSTQPGFNGSPLVGLVGRWAGAPGALDPLDSPLTVRNLAVDGYVFGTDGRPAGVTIESAPLPSGAGIYPRHEDRYRIVVTADGRLLAQVEAAGGQARLALLDSAGRLLVQSDGQGPGNSGCRIDQHILAGTYFLAVEVAAGAGAYVLHAAVTPTSDAFHLDGNRVPIPTQPLPMVAGDFNGDGILDVVLFDGVHLGVGDGTFRSPLASLGLPTNSDLGPMVAGDFNGDGQLDLVVGDSRGSILFLLPGDGDGTFLAGTKYVSGPFVLTNGSIVAGDFNGDGRLDLALDGGFRSEITVLLGRGDFTFQMPQVYPILASGGAILAALVAGDFNGDGRLDLAVANLAGAIDVLLGQADGTLGVGPYRLPVVTTTSSSLASMVAGDFNGDGRLDLAASTGDNTRIPVFLGQGDGSFDGSIEVPVQFASTVIQTGDFDGDGRLDLVLWGGGGVGGEGGFDAFIWFLAGQGDGTFQSPRSIPHTASPLWVFGLISGDFDGDGRLDLVEATDHPRRLTAMLGNGDGTFPSSGASPTDTLPSSVALGDFNGDGRVDLAVPSAPLRSLTILLGDGEGGYRIGQQIPLGESTSLGTPVVGDFNGDGRLDLALSAFDWREYPYLSSLVVLLGNGDGTFQVESNPIAVPGLPPSFSQVLSTELAIGDFNSDGIADLLAIGGDGSPVLFLGRGDGTFDPERVDLLQGLRPYVNALVAGDFNGDGRLDFAINENDYDYGGLYVYLGDGHSGFALSPSRVLLGENVGNILVAGDFDGDGRLDLATLKGTTAGRTTIAVYLGRSDGSFDLARADLPASASDAWVAGDFDGDGRFDLAAWTEDGQGLFLLRGIGDGTFQPGETMPAPPNLIERALATGDLNGDGRPDLLLPDVYNGSIATLLNNGDGTFSAAGQAVTRPQDTPLVADVDGDGVLDLLLVDGRGQVLYRRGRPQEPGTFDPPTIVNPGFPSRDLAWLSSTPAGPLLASIDVRDDAVSLYAFRDGGLVRVGTLPTGRLPAQVLSADLDGDGRDDLIVRNAGDGTLSVSFSGLDRISNPFLPAVTLQTGLGVSDVEVVDTTGTGSLDLVVTNRLTGQVGLLKNWGNNAFAPLVPYRAGIGSSSIDPGHSPAVAGPEAPVGLAGGSLTPGSSISLITANPGTSTLSLLQGLGGGRFANPVVVRGSIQAGIIRAADFNGDGVLDLAVLGGPGVSILLGDGQGGFRPPVTYHAGPDPNGLTIADLSGDGHPDLIVGNPYGDVLVLLNQADGTFAPYHKADQSIALAVADLRGTGSKDVIYVNQGRDRVVVDYGAGNSVVLGDRSSGLLSPGAVKLADLNGDGIPDLIVANTGSNNVLVFPGLGDGQFGPGVNAGHGFFTGTNPKGLDVADLNGDGVPDLLVANSGSNDVSILLGQGTGPSWTMTSGPRIKTGAGPVAVATGHLLGNGTGPLDLAVANQQANNVQVFPGLGNGYFNDTAPVTYAVGQAPSGLFLGSFTGAGATIATLNAGSSTISLIGQSGVIQTIAAGGLRPVAGFAGEFSRSGFTDLVVGNNGDGRFALFTGGPAGLSLSQTLSSPEVSSPTSLSFAGVSDGVLSFYASTAGRETASLLAFNLSPTETLPGESPVPGTEPGPTIPGGSGPNPQGGGSGSLPGSGLAGGTEPSAGSVLESAAAGVFQQVAQLLGRSGSPLDLIAPLFTVSIVPGEFDIEATEEGGVALLASFLPGTSSTAVGQALGLPEESTEGEEGGDAPAPGEETAERSAQEGSALPVWASMAMGLEKAWERVRNDVLEKGGVSREAADRADSDADSDSGSAPSRPAPVAPGRARTSDGSDSRQEGAPSTTGSKVQVAPAAARLELIDLATEALAAERGGQGPPPREPAGGWDELATIHHDRLAGPIGAAVAAAAVRSMARWAPSGRSRLRSGNRIAGSDRRRSG